jgi:hypothetical protein
MDRLIMTEEEILAALNEPFGNNMEYDSEDSDENEIDNIEDIVEDDKQEVDSEKDYMPSSESESETELARNVAPPPAKRPCRNTATASSSSNSSIYIPTTNILNGKNGYKWSSSPFITGKTKERNIIRSIPGPNGKAKYTSSPLETWELFFT